MMSLTRNITRNGRDIEIELNIKSNVQKMCYRPLSRSKAISFSTALVPLSSYFRGMGVLGSAAGRSVSFFILLSTAFKPYNTEEPGSMNCTNIKMHLINNKMYSITNNNV